MAAWTLTEAKAKLQLWLDADAAVASGTQVDIGDKSIRRASPEEIRKNIEFWRGEVQRLEDEAAGKAPFQFIRTRFV